MSEKKIDIKSQLLRMYRIALVDDEFSQSSGSCYPHLPLPEESLKQQRFSCKSRRPNHSPKNEEDKLDYLCELVNMIWIDGKITTEERELSESFRDNFWIPVRPQGTYYFRIIDKKHGNAK